MCLLMELPRNMLFNVVFQKVSSLLGPILYLLYASPLSEIVKKLNLSYHFYADDTQLYLSFQPTISGDRDLAVSNIERCVLEIDHWMLVNRLKLNKHKTKPLVISAKHLPIYQLFKKSLSSVRPSAPHRELEILVSLSTIIFLSTIMLQVFANHPFIIFVISYI